MSLKKTLNGKNCILFQKNESMPVTHQMSPPLTHKAVLELSIMQPKYVSKTKIISHFTFICIFRTLSPQRPINSNKWNKNKAVEEICEKSTRDGIFEAGGPQGP